MYDLDEIKVAKNQSRSAYLKAYSSAKLIQSYRAVAEMTPMDGEELGKQIFVLYELSINNDFKDNKIDQSWRNDAIKQNFPSYDPATPKVNGKLRRENLRAWRLVKDLLRVN